MKVHKLGPEEVSPPSRTASSATLLRLKSLTPARLLSFFTCLLNRSSAFHCSLASSHRPHCWEAPGSARQAAAQTEQVCCASYHQEKGLCRSCFQETEIQEEKMQNVPKANTRFGTTIQGPDNNFWVMSCINYSHAGSSLFSSEAQGQHGRASQLPCPKAPQRCSREGQARRDRLAAAWSRSGSPLLPFEPSQGDHQTYTGLNTGAASAGRNANAW